MKCKAEVEGGWGGGGHRDFLSDCCCVFLLDAERRYRTWEVVGDVQLLTLQCGPVKEHKWKRKKLLCLTEWSTHCCLHAMLQGVSSLPWGLAHHSPWLDPLLWNHQHANNWWIEHISGLSTNHWRSPIHSLCVMFLSATVLEILQKYFKDTSCK